MQQILSKRSMTMNWPGRNVSNKRFCQILVR